MAKEGKIRAVVLCAISGIDAVVGDVIETSDMVANPFVKVGSLDPHPDAVAYAIASGGKVVAIGGVTQEKSGQA